MNIVQDKNMLPDDQWIDVCALDDLTPNTGAGALVGGQAVAIFRVGHEKRVYVLSNKDPFSQANVMSRGIIGDLQGERVVASPIYKQHFSLATGRCLEDKDQKLAVYPSKIVDGRVWVNAVPQKTYITNTGVSQDKLRLVLIGNGLAGMRCLEDLLDMAPDRYEVTVIGEEPWGNYNRIMLSPVLSGEKTIEYCGSKNNAVVIGGGLLGLEAAYGLKQRGMNVTVLHLMDRIMERQLDGRASQLLRHSIEQKGIQIITEANTEALIGDENGHVKQIRLKDGTVLDADLVVFAVGIRPNIALAQSAGLRCNRGVLVNDTMQTFDPSIYAVGECIEHRGQTFGLVEPLWGQAFICATHLAEHGSLTFKAPTVPTQLKVSGVDVFSAGNFEPKDDYEDIILNDEKRQIYKRIIIQNDRVIGAVLFGDTEDGMWYAELIADQTPVSSFRNKLLFGRDFALKNAG